MNQDERMQALTAIQAKYAQDLLELPNVIGVGIGLAQENGAYTEELAIIVMVEKKVPKSELDESDWIPTQLEGYRVDVQEVGAINAF